MENIVTRGKKRNARIIDDKASLSIEAALCLSMFVVLVYSLVVIIQFIFVRSIAKNAAINSAEKISKYSCIFFKSGLADVSENIKGKALKAIGTDNSALRLIRGLADKGIDAVESAAWEGVCRSIMEEEIENELGKTSGNIFDVKLKNLLGSSFFLQGSEFTICATVESDLLVPWIFGGKSIVTTAGASADAWLYGAFSGYDVSDINVWELNQMKRGTVLNSIFGGNLPQMFPTIDIFDSKGKSVTAIISIDTTKKTYKDPATLTNQLIKEAKRLKAFTDGTCDGVTVTENDYTQKELLVIFPENLQTEEQIMATYEAMLECINLGILIRFESYQRSGD